MATYFVDPISGNNSNDGLSFANRKLTLTSFTPAAGDTVKVIASPDPTSLGQSATWTNYSPTVTLTSAVTANISTCDTAWTASANVTATAVSTSGNYKEGSAAAQLVIASGFTTGLVAYFPLGSATDFSAYQQISFWFQAGTASSEFFQIKLCSDAAGVTAVDTVTVPANLLSATTWHAVTVNTGGALGSSIQSVALYATSDPGAVTVRIDNILACKAASSDDSLTLSSLISPQNGMTDTWYPIQSINGTTVILGGPTTLTSGSSNLKGYSGSTQTVTTYKREGLLLATTAGGSSTVSSWATVNGNGTQANPITISGGWNRTDMSTQTGETFVLMSALTNVGMSFGGVEWVDVSKIHFIQFANGYYLNNSRDITITAPQCHAMGVTGINCVGNSSRITITSPRLELNTAYGITPGNNTSISSPWCAGNLTNNYNFDTSNNCMITGSPVSKNSPGSGIVWTTGANNRIYNLSSDSNAASMTVGTGINYLINATLSDSTESSGGINWSGGQVFSHKNDATTDNHKVFMDFAQIASDTGSDRHTASGMAWKLSPTSTNRFSGYPVELVLARIACRANKLVTVKVWEKRSTSTITARLVCKGGQIGGVSNDVVATAAGANNTYEQISITFTPTEQGVVEITAQAYGGNTDSAWFDDLTVYQS